MRGDLQVLQRFRREVQALTRLSHPNIVQALDVEEVGTAHYYAMEFVAGGTLDEIIEQGGPLPVAAACDFARQAALALRHANQQGLIHRDIKPGNMLLAPAPGSSSDSMTLPPETRPGHWGTVKLLDLGLARVEDPAPGDPFGGMVLTQAGFMLGTVDYMAPEQVQRPHEADTRADIYGLGCTLYHMLTGQPPFPGGEMIDKLNRHQTKEPTPVEELRPEVPPALGAVVRKMMAKKPEGRYQTPATLADALGRVLAQLDAKLLAPGWQPPRIAARVARKKEPANNPVPANPSWPPLSMVVGVIIFVGSFVVFWLLFGR
jgi:serine/threonine protein kinase